MSLRVVLVRECVCVYGCTVVRKTDWSTGCQCDLWMISLSFLILKQGELSSVSHLAVQSLSSLWHVRGVGVGRDSSRNWNLANLSVVFSSPSPLLLFLGLLGIKQRELGLWPTHLLSVTSLILVAMQFSFLSIFNVAKLVMYEEQFVLWRTTCWRQSKSLQDV